MQTLQKTSTPSRRFDIRAMRFQIITETTRALPLPYYSEPLQRALDGWGDSVLRNRNERTVEECEAFAGRLLYDRKVRERYLKILDRRALLETRKREVAAGTYGPPALVIAGAMLDTEVCQPHGTEYVVWEGCPKCSAERQAQARAEHFSLKHQEAASKAVIAQAEAMVARANRWAWLGPVLFILLLTGLLVGGNLMMQHNQAMQRQYPPEATR